jgi:hypothetical protein
MMTLLSTFNYIPAFIVGLVMIFLSVKVVLLPMADLITKIRDKTTDVAIYPLSVFMGVPLSQSFCSCIFYSKYVCLHGWIGSLRKFYSLVVDPLRRVFCCQKKGGFRPFLHF